MNQLTVYKKGNSKSNIEQRLSRVLLVCVYDTIVFELSKDAIYSRFKKFGQITKLLIFEKGQVTKFFIQFEKEQDAYNAKCELDGAKLFQALCKMAIYFSNFQAVDLKHQTSEGTNYIQQQQTTKQFIHNFDKLTKSSQQQDFMSEMHDELIMSSFDQFGYFVRSKTEEPKILQFHIKQRNKFEQEHEKNSIQKGIENILKSDEKQSEVSSTAEKTIQIKQTPISKEILSFEMKYFIRLQNIYNLFSNFGNISCIVTKNSVAHVKFRSLEFAAIANSYLNHAYFYGNFLAFQDYSVDSNSILLQEGQFGQSMYFDKSYDRFTAQRSITINPPSHALHISSIKRELCKQSALRKIFSEYGYVEKVKVLQQSQEKNMALVRFSSIEDSFAAIADLHNKVFLGRKMQISFTKSKF